MPPTRLAVIAFLLGAASLPAATLALTADEIELATYSGGTLPDGRSALTAKVQLLLDRSGVSPGVLDGIRGGMSESAISAFERRAGLPVDGRLDAQVWEQLQQFAGQSATRDYTITQEDAQKLSQSIPEDYLEKANMTWLGYTSVRERIAERFHMHEDLLAALNPGASFQPGETVKVMAVNDRLKAEVTRIFVEKGTNRVAGYDAEGHLVVNYPATIGSAQTPSPTGEVVVEAVAIDPEYTYNPQRNFQQGDNDQPLQIPPGPNGPVGSIWIDLSKPTYGIHGTPNPSRLFVSESHGCVRLTNWDATELAHMVRPGTRVEFLEPGRTSADVMGPARGIARAVQDAARPGQPTRSVAPTGSVVPGVDVTPGQSAGVSAADGVNPTATSAAATTSDPDGGSAQSPFALPAEGAAAGAGAAQNAGN